MTNEELDNARVTEAFRIYGKSPTDRGLPTLPQIVARLAREGWMPVDPLLIEAREIAAKIYDAEGYEGTAEQYRKGKIDDGVVIKSVLAALKREDRDWGGAEVIAYYNESESRVTKQQKRPHGRPRVSGSLREKLRALAVSPIGTTLRVENSSNTVRATIYDESQKGFLGDAIFTVAKADPSGADVWRIE